MPGNHHTRALVPSAAGGSVAAALDGEEELITTIRRDDGTQVLLMLMTHEGRPFLRFRHLPSGRSFSFRITELGTLLGAFYKILHRMRRDEG